MSVWNKIADLARHPNAKKAKAGLAVSSDLLRNLWYAKEAGPWAQALAVAASVVEIADDLLPRMTPVRFLEDRGYKIRMLGAENFLFKLIEDSQDGVPVYEGDGTEIRVWEEAGFAVIEHDDVDYMQYAVRDEEQLSIYAQKVVWARGRELMLMADGDPRQRRSRLAESSLKVVPMGSAPPYFGLPAASHYSSRIRVHREADPEGTRSLLLVGPSGVGKGVLARAIAREIEPEGRVLKIASSTLEEVDLSVLVDLTRIIRPSVLLLDDLPLDYSGGRASDGMLALFEALRGNTSTIIGTVMASAKAAEADGEAEDEGPLSFSCTGLRPGRVDEVYFLSLPDAAEREALLRYYLNGYSLPSEVMSCVVEETAGLTGAYLAEIALRLSRFGHETWEAEVESVWRISDQRRGG